MDKKPALFIDRDGVINKKMPEDDYVKSWDEFEFLPGVIEAFQILKSAGFLVIIITNQRCVARGIITEEELRVIHDRMKAEIEKKDGALDALYVCPHGINACDCRKPKPGMILQAISDFKKNSISIDVGKSYIIDDSKYIEQMGRNCGLKTIRINKSAATTARTAPNLLQAIQLITKEGALVINVPND